MSDVEFTPTLVRESLSEQVARYLELLIDSGKLKMGDRLPPERELAETLEVGRGVVREAIRLLVSQGLVTIKPGRGTYVAEIGSDYITDHLGRYLRMSNQSHSDLNELRQIIEVEIATFAAHRAQPECIEAMQQAIRDMDACESEDSAQAYVAADQSFHMALAQAARNELFPLFLEAISDRLEASRLLIYSRVPGAPQRGQVYHRRILEAIINKNAPAARQAMCDHMKQVFDDTQAI